LEDREKQRMANFLKKNAYEKEAEKYQCLFCFSPRFQRFCRFMARDAERLGLFAGSCYAAGCKPAAQPENRRVWFCGRDRKQVPVHNVHFINE
jgi:hypothetical protein